MSAETKRCSGDVCNYDDLALLVPAPCLILYLHLSTSTLTYIGPLVIEPCIKN
jgi:hypothetical protein